MRREEEYVGKRVMEVARKRRRGRPKRRWLDNIKNDSSRKVVGERTVREEGKMEMYIDPSWKECGSEEEDSC